MNRTTEVRAAVEAEVQRILEHSGRPLQSPQDDDALFRMGLDSLDLAQLVVALEQRLGVDPFRKQGSPIRTFGDLINAYRIELEKN